MAGDFEEDPHDEDIFSSTGVREFRHIHLDTAQGIARITLNRPPANVLSVEAMQELAAAVDSLEYQRDVKLVTLFGAGKYFSAGFELDDHLGDRAYPMLESFRRIFEGLAKVDKPTLSVVAGPALGAGCILAAGCDMVVAAQSAKLGFPEIRGGVFNTVAAALLPRLVGRKRAFELLMVGTSLGAAEAERLGLVTRVVPDERLDAEVAALVQRFQESSAPVLQLARRAVAGGLDLPFAEAVSHAEDVYLNHLLNTQDVEEGLLAVREKRKPAWKDR
ncbi:MAG TPA: enoyl-CoA hydratase/isomerase family protein [Vicinamibacteria bacterium]|nr:enoyl-CoA hydratase/isomerase family protein [Vicinamibacteria bacterium]